MKYRYNPAWSSHLPILIKVLTMAQGPALELGMGPFSSPVMHWLCLDQKKILTSYDNNKDYHKANLSFANDKHGIFLTDDWDNIPIYNTHWGVVLVDHSPDYRRKEEIKKLANKADYIVVHDTQSSEEKLYHYEEIYPLFKYRYNYKRQKPYTTVLSNFKDLSNL